MGERRFALDGTAAFLASRDRRVQQRGIVRKLMTLGYTVVSIVTRLRSSPRNTQASRVARTLSANNSPSLLVSRLHQRLRFERSRGKLRWKNSSSVKYWKYGS